MIVQEQDSRALRTAIEAANPGWFLADEAMSAYSFRSVKRRRFRPRGKRPAAWTAFEVPPSAIDWRTAGRIFPPMDQGDCNSCTAFALSAVMSDLRAATAPSAVPLSPGHLHQCIGGCACSDGLDPGRAVSALRTMPVAAHISGDYPFDARLCDTTRGVVKLAGTTPLRSAVDAKLALRAGPIFAVMELYDDFWRFYRGGVYRQAAGNWLASHSIEIVGYDDDAEAWIVKNSRGSAWGTNGFAYIAYDECGILTPDGNGGLQLKLG
ncbi:MAG: hypothetical protein MEP44_00755 [Blastomonas sp.]|nr:hypothetical protein [Blastomonas sp.]